MFDPAPPQPRTGQTAAVAIPADYVDGELLTGTVDEDAPVGVAETVEFARRLHNKLIATGTTVAAISRTAEVEAGDVIDLLDGCSHPNVVLLARLEHAFDAGLWPHP